MRKNEDKGFLALGIGMVVIWVMAALLSLGLTGVIIWAIIYALTHMGEWVN